VTRRFFPSRALQDRERATGQQDIAGRLQESVAQVKPPLPDTCDCGCGERLDPLALMAGATKNTACAAGERGRAHRKGES
jgi:hypothetical protein